MRYFFTHLTHPTSGKSVSAAVLDFKINTRGITFDKVVDASHVRLAHLRDPEKLRSLPEIDEDMIYLNLSKLMQELSNETHHWITQPQAA